MAEAAGGLPAIIILPALHPPAMSARASLRGDVRKTAIRRHAPRRRAYAGSLAARGCGYRGFVHRLPESFPGLDNARRCDDAARSRARSGILPGDIGVLPDE